MRRRDPLEQMSPREQASDCPEDRVAGRERLVWQLSDPDYPPFERLLPSAVRERRQGQEKRNDQRHETPDRQAHGERQPRRDRETEEAWCEEATSQVVEDLPS